MELQDKIKEEVERIAKMRAVKEDVVIKELARMVWEMEMEEARQKRLEEYEIP